MTTEQQIRKTLEDLIDSHSLSHVLGSLQDVCTGKAKHFRSLCESSGCDYTDAFRVHREREASNWDAAGRHVYGVLRLIGV